MLHRFHLEALDRLLRQLKRNDKKFGGIPVILAGDFRLFHIQESIYLL